MKRRARRLLVIGAGLTVVGLPSACSGDEGQADDARGTTTTTTAVALARPDEPVLGMPPELDRTSEAELVAELDASVRSVIDRAPTVDERQRFTDTFWQAELAWALAEGRGIGSPRPDVHAEALRFAENLATDPGR